MERIGVVAGKGDFPVVFAEEARKKGAKVIAFAIANYTRSDFGKFVDKIHWINPENFKIQKFIFLLLAERIRKIVLVGKIDKSLAFERLKDNKDVTTVLGNIKDRSDYSILDEVTRRFSKVGIQVADGLEYLKDLLPQKGVLTKRIPSENEREDIEFGFRIAKEIARLDIGQTIAVKNKSVVCVEGMEGTDEIIKRAGEIVKSEFTVIKVARPNQDMRWDVPLVGLDTINVMIESKARVLAIENGRMFLVDKRKVINLADLNEITIVVV